MTRRTIGIDCGLNGAIALVVDGELVRVEDMPTVTSHSQWQEQASGVSA
jgi:hypothetical protein